MCNPTELEGLSQRRPLGRSRFHHGGEEAAGGAAERVPLRGALRQAERGRKGRSARLEPEKGGGTGRVPSDVLSRGRRLSDQAISRNNAVILMEGASIKYVRTKGGG